MKTQMLKKLKLPDKPGVYFFLGKQGKVLYIGKATSLRNRVKSYFSRDLSAARGIHIQRMVGEAKTVKTQTTDSVLEALVLESALIKKHKPRYNTDEKDDKSFNHIVITKEEFPRVLIVRARDLREKLKVKSIKLQAIFGPFPRGGELREAVKIIRKIFPFRDKCTPAIISQRFSETKPLGIRDRHFKKQRTGVGKEIKAGKPCFNRQIGLCPGVCSGEVSKEEYGRQIRNLKLFLSGKKKMLVKNLEREMKAAARAERFEEANKLKKQLFALNHIQDVALMKREAIRKQTGEIFRVEAYDAAHLSGKNSVAVMTAIEDGEANKNEYRKFKLRSSRAADDLSALEEVLRRRFNHLEWRMPNIVVVDGGANQKRRAEKVLGDMKISVPVLSVVKNEFHKPRAILGEAKIAREHEREILLSNSEAHRFAVRYHRELRDKIIRE